MEIRTKKIIRTRVFGTGTCGHSLTRDPAVLYIRHAQPKSPRMMDLPRYKIIEPRKPREAKVPSDIFIRTSSPLRSRPLKFRFPFLDRTAESDQDSETESDVEWESSSDEVSIDSDRESVCSPRGRHRSRQMFVAGKPENERGAQRRTLQSPPPKTRLFRSPTKVCFGSDIEVDGADVSPHYPRSRRPSGGPHQPRDTTPISRHEHPRREARIVEIHNHHRASPCEERVRSPDRRKVRFASDVEYVKNTNRARDTRVREQERYHARPPRHGPSIRGPESNYRATCRRSSPERPLMGRCRRTSASGERARPRIIHVGNRQMSEAAERIRKEAWRRHSREDLLCDMKSQGGWRRYTRRSDDRIIYNRGSRQYGCY
ncbi:hypothetical protein BDV32DRAFT_130042 [Aspergillus pseudonomiae]|uniref:Uncharacterized protein n=1 Tax=Aspergillus pseudonomiae TaxID=1506151 RepID=A0A5N6HR83_9EURO|nr:uncharacterized protein BDV37DRAFT_32970 [Aspergillus pseudonomiae]KAB8255900.1 hypothetical protein BDV32DRAFT_130042 [Aspergillus pseudonomiae]KAE8398347.1 hypothetical protein BDV37DRAFT_32970 [Aspergillus pseudonomiae]